MKNLKNTFAAVMMMGVMVFGTTLANAGIIIAGRNANDTKQTQKSDDPCGTPSAETKSDFGIIIAGFVGIIIAGRTGIIIAGRSDEPVVNCGIIIAG